MARPIDHLVWRPPAILSALPNSGQISRRSVRLWDGQRFNIFGMSAKSSWSIWISPSFTHLDPPPSAWIHLQVLSHLHLDLDLPPLQTGCRNLQKWISPHLPSCPVMPIFPHFGFLREALSFKVNQPRTDADSFFPHGRWASESHLRPFGSTPLAIAEVRDTGLQLKEGLEKLCAHRDLAVRGTGLLLGVVWLGTKDPPICRSGGLGGCLGGGGGWGFVFLGGLGRVCLGGTGKVLLLRSVPSMLPPRSKGWKQ